MKVKLLAIIILSALILSEKSFSKGLTFKGFEKGQESISFFLGQPTFVRYDKFINWKRSWSADLGYHFDKYPYLAANYNFYFYNVKDRLRKKDFFNSLMFYAGPGFFIGPDFGEDDSDKKIKLGLRVFGGFEYLFLEKKMSVKAEVGPAFYIEVSDDTVGFQGVVGLTYYWGGIKGLKTKTKNSSEKSKVSNTEDDTENDTGSDSSIDKEFEEFD